MRRDAQYIILCTFFFFHVYLKNRVNLFTHIKLIFFSFSFFVFLRFRTWFAPPRMRRILRSGLIFLNLFYSLSDKDTIIAPVGSAFHMHGAGESNAATVGHWDKESDGRKRPQCNRIDMNAGRRLGQRR